MKEAAVMADDEREGDGGAGKVGQRQLNQFKRQVIQAVAIMPQINPWERIRRDVKYLDLDTWVDRLSDLHDRG